MKQISETCININLHKVLELQQVFRERNKAIRDNKEYQKVLIDLDIERAI